MNRESQHPSSGRPTIISYLWIRITLRTTGLFSLGLGILGIALPLLPTTPFVLLSAWCFARSSQRLHTWLIQHRIIGPHLRNWYEYRAIPVKAKINAVTLIIVTITVAIVFVIPVVAVQILVGAICAVISAYLITRPSPPGRSHEDRNISDGRCRPCIKVRVDPA